MSFEYIYPGVKLTFLFIFFFDHSIIYSIILTIHIETEEEILATFTVLYRYKTVRCGIKRLSKIPESSTALLFNVMSPQNSGYIWKINWRTLDVVPTCPAAEHLSELDRITCILCKRCPSTIEMVGLFSLIHTSGKKWKHKMWYFLLQITEKEALPAVYVLFWKRLWM